MPTKIVKNYIFVAPLVIPYHSCILMALECLNGHMYVTLVAVRSWRWPCMGYKVTVVVVVDASLFGVVCEFEGFFLWFTENYGRWLYYAPKSSNFLVQVMLHSELLVSLPHHGLCDDLKKSIVIQRHHHRPFTATKPLNHAPGSDFSGGRIRTYHCRGRSTTSMAASEIMKTEFNLFTKYDVIVELLIGQKTERHTHTRPPTEMWRMWFSFWHVFLQ